MLQTNQNRIKTLLIFASVALFFPMLFSCTDDNDSGSDDNYVPVPVSTVELDMDAFPFNTLSEYNFFEDNMKGQEPVFGVIPYEPFSTLFTDNAKMKPFVWMPNDVQSTCAADNKFINYNQHFETKPFDFKV